ncbi:hypothetical protein PEX1_074580 [Penicillium expansum]|uniref:Protein kinase domain-containing protein n=1 Tax=Penicillium expansum TaxID=27334 RepID=A0A0A2L3D0_PENEN|nr:hypothetical protein PEX2_055050 [Penicillium expansum]KGO40440.1 hypothetical protein PEXP_030160 [Penicillium expansum]KGO59664.1 hypothetical protein PEX2_055050 [Penicillium expansum]KGO73683.1 hypothetical protein PEX1_074580 [Penicillium expansum]
MADPISILSVVDLCFKYGTRLVQLCTAAAHAKDDVKERSLRVETFWMRTEVQLNVVRGIASELSEKHRVNQHATIAMLATKLEIAINSVESTIKSHPVGNQKLQIHRWKYAFTKEKIDRAIEDLKDWQALFDPSWFLIMKLANHHQVDVGLEKSRKYAAIDFNDPIPPAQALRTALNPTVTNAASVCLRSEALISINPQDIPFCSAQVGQRPENGQSLILERIEPLPGANVGDMKKDIRDLARRLNASDAIEFGLLSCKGYIQHKPDSSQSTPDAFTIIFRMPEQHLPHRSLRGCFQDMNHTHSLSDRFKLANELAKAVHSVHLFGFVHKNIRPETILLLGGDESSIGSAFLIGFDSFRMASGRTLRKGEASWERCLYQHPDRIGTISPKDYIMQHDIYSLGVCLLELGLWESFVSYNELSSSNDNALSPTRASILGTGRGLYFQKHLLFLAKGELRKRMGTKYSDVVVTCLTCLDAENVDFGDEGDFEDVDGIEVGVRYIEKVCFFNPNVMPFKIDL